MRVGLLIYGSLDLLTGGFVYDRVLVEHLRSQGDEVEVIALPWRTYRRHLSDNISFTFFRRLRRTPLDVLLQDELNHPSLVWLNRRLKRHLHYPLVSIVHHLRCSEARPVWQNRLYRWVEHRYLVTLDGLIFNSQTTRQTVEGLIGGGTPAIVAPPGGDRLQPNLSPEQILARAHEPGPLRVVFVGSLIARKELHTVLDGLTRLPRDSWQLDVIGSLSIDPGYVESIRRRLSQAGLSSQVRLLGVLSDTALATRLAHSHLLAVPSSYEGFGIVYLEGMGFGLPAIASTAGAAGEIICHGRDGFLIISGDSTALAHHVHQLSQDRQRLGQMSLAAQGRYAEHPTWENSMARIHRFLHTLVDTA